nr:AraC family transcriptional regulator [Pigmentiphaga litoralis]
MHHHVTNTLSAHHLDVRSVGFRASLRQGSVGSMRVCELEYGSIVQADPGRLDDYLLIQMLQAGQSRVYHEGNETLLSCDMAGVIAPTIPFRALWERDCRHVMLKIPRSKLEQACSSYLGHDLGGSLQFRIGMDLRTPTGQAWKHLMEYVLGSAPPAESCAISPIIHGHMEEAAIAHLLIHQSHNFSEALKRANDSSINVPSCVRRAEQYIEDHLLDAITLTDVAEYAGVSVSTLCHSFRRHRGSSLMCALRGLRLEGARKELLTGNGRSIVDVAYEWGFNHAGRFSISYRKRFGESPTQTLQR